MATNIYINIDGIAGNSTSANYPNQFEALSLDFGVSESSTGQISSSPVTATIREYNLARLFTTAASGKHLTKVTFSVVGYDANGNEFLVESITLIEVVISQVQYSAAGDAPILELAFSYSKIQIVEPT